MGTYQMLHVFPFLSVLEDPYHEPALLLLAHQPAEISKNQYKNKYKKDRFISPPPQKNTSTTHRKWNFDLKYKKKKKK